MLTKDERDFLKNLAIYCSGQIQDIKRDEASLDVIVGTDEKAKRALIKEHRESVLIPNLQRMITQCDNQKARLEAELTVTKNLVKEVVR